MSEKEKDPVQESSDDTQMYYIIGAVVLVIVVAMGYFLWPKSPTTALPAQTVAPLVPTPTPGPITGLACEKQYYNPVIGLPKYYLSVEGVDVPDAKSVSCNIAVSVGEKTVARESTESALTAVPERNGGVFRCTTKGLELKKSIPTKIDVTLEDDLNETATCSSVFILP